MPLSYAFAQHVARLGHLLGMSNPYTPVAANLVRPARQPVLQGDLGRVQLAVLAECIAERGDPELFVERYLSIRRKLGIAVIRRGQRDGAIASTRSPEALWDQIYARISTAFNSGCAG